MLMHRRREWVQINTRKLREGHVMNDVAGRIEELEVKAAESALIADLTTNWEVRQYNAMLARDLRLAAESLRQRARIIKGELQ
jgi:hypothetical protein